MNNCLGSHLRLEREDSCRLRIRCDICWIETCCCARASVSVASNLLLVLETQGLVCVGRGVMYCQAEEGQRRQHERGGHSGHHGCQPRQAGGMPQLGLLSSYNEAPVGTAWFTSGSVGVETSLALQMKGCNPGQRRVLLGVGSINCMCWRVNLAERAPPSQPHDELPVCRRLEPVCGNSYLDITPASCMADDSICATGFVARTNGKSSFLPSPC